MIELNALTKAILAKRKSGAKEVRVFFSKGRQGLKSVDIHLTAIPGWKLAVLKSDKLAEHIVKTMPLKEAETFAVIEITA